MSKFECYSYLEVSQINVLGDESVIELLCFCYSPLAKFSKQNQMKHIRHRSIGSSSNDTKQYSKLVAKNMVEVPMKLYVTAYGNVNHFSIQKHCADALNLK